MVVWRYDGMQAQPDVPPPSPGAAARGQALAVPVWPHIPAICRRAAELGGFPLPGLPGVLVHPPAVGGLRWPPDGWIRAVQVMACPGIAHHRAGQPWLQPERCAVLYALLNGPEDWVTKAAAFALAVSGWMDPELCKDVGVAVGFRWSKAVVASQTRPVSILESLTGLVPAIPWLQAGVLDLAREKLVWLRRAEPEPLAPERAAELEAIARSNAPGRPAQRRRRSGFRRD